MLHRPIDSNGRLFAKATVFGRNVRASLVNYFPSDELFSVQRRFGIIST